MEMQERTDASRDVSRICGHRLRRMDASTYWRCVKEMMLHEIADIGCEGWMQVHIWRCRRGLMLQEFADVDCEGWRQVHIGNAGEDRCLKNLRI